MVDVTLIERVSVDVDTPTRLMGAAEGLVFATTPLPGDVVMVAIANYSDGLGALVESVTGLSATWTIAATAHNAFLIASDATTAGAVTVTFSEDREAPIAQVTLYLVRGLTSASVATLTNGGLTTGEQPGPELPAGEGQFVVSMMRLTAPAALTFPSTAFPATGWSSNPPDGAQFGETYRIPTEISGVPHRTDSLTAAASVRSSRIIVVGDLPTAALASGSGTLSASAEDVTTGGPYTVEVLADSPLAYYRLGEASGTTLVDTSGNAHNGTYTVAPALAATGLIVGDADTAADFQGGTTGGHAAIASATWMDASALTIEAWVKRESTSSEGYIISRDNNSGNRDWRLKLVNTTGRLDFAVWNTAGTLYQLLPTNVLANNTTYHVVGTFDGSFMKLYVDGVEIASVACTGTPRVIAQQINIGSFNGSTSGRFNGVLDEIAYYGTALSAARIAAHHVAGTVLPPATVEVSLVGQSQRRTGAFSMNSSALAEVVLIGTSRRRVGAITLSHASTMTLAGSSQRRLGAFALTSSGTMTLAGEVRRRVGEFALNLPPQVVLAGEVSRRQGTFTVRVAIPVTPAPLPAGDHSEVVAQAFGAVTMQGSQAVYTVSEAALPRARQRIVVDGIDVTYFRNTITPNVSYTLLEPLLYGPAMLELPQVSACFERLGVGALSWLREGAPVEVQYVLDDEVVSTAWKGFIVAFDTSGRTLSVELGGEVNGRAALRNRQVPIFPRINDLGHQIADSIVTLGMPFEPRIGPVTHLEAMTTGGTGHLDHIQALIAKAWTRAGRQWTVMPDPATGVYELHRKNDETIHGTVFIDDARTVASLRRDIAEEPNRIYMSGVTPTGQRVRFGVYPGLVQGNPPAFPGHMEEGDTGDGVRMLILKLQAMGYLKLEDAAGGYDEDVVNAVTDLQIDAGLFDEGFTGTAVPGEVNLVTWNALYDLDVTGLSAETAHIEPAAQRSKVRMWNRSGSGNIMAPNPNYDSAEIVRDRNLDAGAAGLNRSQLREQSRTVLHDSNDPNWVGTITFHTGALIRGDGFQGMTVDAGDVMPAHEIRPGMNLDLPQFDGGTLVHVAACEVNTEGIVTATVDTRFRDAMEVWEVMARNRESRRDPARSRERAHRSSTVTKDSIGEWDEIGGLLGNDVDLEIGWTVFPVVAAMEGTIARLKINTTPAAEFVTAVFGEKVGPGTLMALVGNPLTKAGTKAWAKETVRTELEREYELLYVAGDREQPCGYYPKAKLSEGDEDNTPAPLTGKWDDEAGFGYRSRVRHMVWVAVWSDRASKIEAGRIMWPQLEAGV